MNQAFTILATIAMSALLMLSIHQRKEAKKDLDAMYDAAIELSKESYKRGWADGYSRGRNYPYAEARQLFESDSIGFNNLIKLTK